MHKLIAAFIATLVFAGGVAEAFPKGEFFIQRAKLTQRESGSWSGRATLDGIKGRLTITGKVVLLTQEKHTIHWKWVAGDRRVSGCSVNEVLSRPNGVLLWDGSGRITRTSAKERKYAGRSISLYGPTKKSDLTHAQISIAQFHPHPGLRARKCR